MIKILEYISLIALCLIPISLLTGPFLPDLLLCISSIVFIVIVLKKKLFHYLKSKLLVFFFLYCLYLIILSIFSKHPQLSLESSLFYFRFGVFAVAISYFFQEKKFFVKYISISIFLSLLILLFDSLSVLVFEKSLSGNSYNGRVYTSFFYDEKIMGSYIARLLPLMFFLVYYLTEGLKKNYTKYLLILIIYAASVFLVIMSGERTAIVILFIVSILLFFIKFDKLSFIFVILFSTLFTSIIIYNSEYTSSILRGVVSESKISELKSNNFKFNLKDIKIPRDYYNIYKNSFNIFKDNYLFGIGPKNFREICKNSQYWSNSSENSGCSTHPHHVFIQLLVETGLFGLIPVLSIFLYSILKFFKNFYTKLFINKIDYNNNYLILLIPIIINLMPIIPSGNFFNNWLSIVYFLPIGFLLNYYIEKK